MAFHDAAVIRAKRQQYWQQRPRTIIPRKPPIPIGDCYPVRQPSEVLEAPQGFSKALKDKVFRERPHVLGLLANNFVSDMFRHQGEEHL